MPFLLVGGTFQRILIHGPAASGKSSLANQIVCANPDWFHGHEITDSQESHNASCRVFTTCLDLSHLPPDWLKQTLVIPMVKFTPDDLNSGRNCSTATAMRILQANPLAFEEIDCGCTDGLRAMPRAPHWLVASDAQSVPGEAVWRSQSVQIPIVPLRIHELL